MRARDDVSKQWTRGRGTANRAYSERKNTMRNLRKLVQILVVAAFLVLPVMAISAQRGSMNNDNVWDGASDWPGVTGIVAPKPCLRPARIVLD